MSSDDRDFFDFFANASVGLHCVGPDGRILRANQAELDLLGYTREEYLGRHIMDFHADGQVIEDILERLGRGETLKNYPARLRCKDGSIRHVLISSNVLFEDGKFVHTRCFTVDVTDQTNAQEALRESEERFRALTLNAPAAIFIKDPEGRYTFANELAAKALARDDIVGHTDHELMPRQFADALRTHDLAVIETGQPMEREETVEANGVRRDFLSVKFPLLDSSGGTSGVCGMAVEITDRRRAQREIAESKRFLQSTLDSLGAHIAVLDDDGTIMTVNDAWRAFAEENGFLGGEAALGQNYLDVCDLAAARGCVDAAEVAQGIRDVLAERIDSFTREYPCHSPKKKRWFQLRVTRFATNGPHKRVVVSHETITERRAAEDELRASEGRYRAIVESQSEMVCRFRPDGTILFVNGAYARARGSSPEKLVGVNLWDFVSKEDRSDVRAMLGRLCPEAPEIQIENRFETSDGTRWTLWTNRALAFDSENRATEVQSTGLDITDRKRAEHALQDSEQLLKRIIYSLPGAIYTIDANGCIMLFNEAAAALWGRTPVIGAERSCGSYKIFHPDGRPMPMHECPMAITLREQRPIRNAEIVIERPDGTRRHVLANPEPIFDSKGRLTGAVNMLVDITERKEAERTRAFLAAIVESTDDAVISKTLDGRITSWNEGAERIFGYTADEAVGQSINLIVPPELRGEERMILKRLRRGERVEHFETLRQAKSGDRVNISLTISPLRDNDGRIIGASNVARDITRRKRLDEALREKTAALETINRVNLSLTSELNLESLLESVADAATLLSGAEFGAFFQHAADESGEKLLLSAVSGLQRVAFEQSIDSLKTTVFEPLFRETTIVRSDDVVDDSRFEGVVELRSGSDEQIPLRSLLAIPIVSRSNDVIGGLFLGHSQAGVFTDHAQQVVSGIAAQAAVAIENARLYEQIQQVEESRRFSIQAAGAGTWTWNLSTGDAIWSPECRDLFGFDSDLPVTYESWRAALHPEDRERADDEVRRTALRREDLNLEYRIRHPHRGERWLISIGRSVDPVSHPSLMTGITLDVTERKEAESALKAREAELELIAETTPLILERCSRDLRFLYANHAAAALFGLTPDELIGKPIAEAIGDRAFSLVKPHIDRVLQGETVEFELEIPYPSAGRRWMHMNYAPDVNDQSVVKGWFASIVDISERKRAEEALRRSEERFRFMANVSPAIIWTASPEGAITWASDRWFEYTGIPRDLNASEWPEVLHPDDRLPCVEAWKRAIEEGCDYEIEVRNRRHDGEYRWFVTRATPICDAGGRVVEWYGSTTDIHDQKQVEEALKDADRRKDEFLAILAHELRNPLAPLRSALDLLDRTKGDSVRLDDTTAIMDRQLTHMVRLVDDLLDISRISRGKIRLQKQRVELMQILRLAIETTQPVADRADQSFEVELTIGNIEIEADPARLTQVFHNLLNNACKYSPRGSVVHTTVRRERDEVCVVVKDSGIGIPRHQLQSIFEMFSQVDEAREAAPGGLGIGLSLVNGLVELHGGSIEARSEGRGRGSEFIVRLPLKNASPRATDPFQNGQLQKAASSVPNQARRVLIVDDNDDAAEALARLLRLDGHETEIAHDGVQAVRTAESFRPEVILLDIGLPIMNGYEVCRAIRKMAWGRDTLIIAMTGWGQAEDKRRAKEAGFNHHLTKPADEQVLNQLIAESREFATSGD